MASVHWGQEHVQTRTQAQRWLLEEPHNPELAGCGEPPQHFPELHSLAMGWAGTPAVHQRQPAAAAAVAAAAAAQPPASSFSLSCCFLYRAAALCAQEEG